MGQGEFLNINFFTALFTLINTIALFLVLKIFLFKPIMKMIADHDFDLIINIPKNHTKRELTNGYRIRRAAIDHNIPLITNARLASAFIRAFCKMGVEEIPVKSWEEYK